MAQHFQHWPPGGAAGLAVVHRGRLAAGQQGPAHMGGARVFGAQGRHLRLCAGAVGHRFDAGDELAFDDQLMVGRDGQGEGHGHIARRQKGAG